MHYALKMVGAPYRYSGNTPRGFDCSSLVHYSFARAKVSVPGTAISWGHRLELDH